MAEVTKIDSSSYMSMLLLTCTLKCFSYPTNVKLSQPCFLTLVFPMTNGMDFCGNQRDLAKQSHKHNKMSGTFPPWEKKYMQSVVREQTLSLGKVNQPDTEIKSTHLVSLVLCSMQLDCSVSFIFLVRRHPLISQVLSAVIN